MSGVRVGSRLEQLVDLRRQVNVQIEFETRANPLEAIRLGLLEGTATTTRRRKRRSDAGATKGPNAVDLRLQELGVTAHDVKAWAVAAGIIPEAKTGRVAGAIVEQYAAAQAATS